MCIRLADGFFQWPRTAQEARSISAEEYKRLMDGFAIDSSDATGQYYLRARYYNPILGRFMQEDTYQDDGLKLYAYCKNNPVMYYDPSRYACGSSGVF